VLALGQTLAFAASATDTDQPLRRKQEQVMRVETRSLLAGVSRRCINPPAGIAHGGWGAQKHEQAEGIDMDLWVTALALAEPKTIHLDVDIQILTNERADQIRATVSLATGIPVSRIRAAATHTHSGPVPYKSWIEKGFELVDPWFRTVAELAGEAAREALAQLQPVRVRTGKGACRINTNRRAVTCTGEPFLGVNADGPCDREVQVVQLDGFAGEPIATLVNYACHPTIMGPSNRLITPDFPGAMKRVVEQAVGGHCLFFQGSAGDQGPLLGFQAEPALYRQFGGILGHEVARVATELRALPSAVRFREVIPSGAPLGMYASEFVDRRGLPVQAVETEIIVPLRTGLPEKKAAAEKLEQCIARLRQARERNDGAAITEATYLARRADIQLRMADDFGGKTSAGVRTHLLAFGDVALVGCNIEPFCEIGMAIKERSPFPMTFMCGYTNGRMAYLPTRVEWSKGGYEVENSPFGQDAAEELTEKLVAELVALYRNRTR
jgi:hypothetical protein